MSVRFLEDLSVEGNIGIGTTSPSSTLTINQTNDNGIKLIGYDDRDDASANIYIDSGGHLKINNTNGSASGYIIIEAENYLNLRANSFVYFTSNVRVYDSNQFGFGSGNDLIIQHDGSHSYISQSGTGNLYIQQNTNDADMVFQCDDGSGGTTAYLTLDGSETKTIVSQTMEFQDNVKLAVGNSEDLIIDHNATDSRVINYTGDLRIVNSANDKDITLESDDGSGGITPYLTLDGSSRTANIDVPIKVNDQIVLDSKQAYTLPAQGTRMRILQITNHTLCRLYLESSENSYHQPIVLDIFYKAQSTGSKPQIVRSENYQWHTHSNDIIFTSDGASSPGADTYIYAEKVAYSTGRSVNIRKIEVFDGDLTVLDGSTTDTNGGTDETVESTFSEITSTGKIIAEEVGIGTTSPTYNLDVQTPSDIIARFKSTDNKGAIAISDDDTTAYISAENSRIGFGTSPALSTQNITMLTGNNFVGIGVTSPAVKLDVAGDAQLQGTSPRLVMKETGTSKDFSLKVQTDGRFSVLNDNLASELLTIEQGGNVGIGTTSPSSALDVQGEIKSDKTANGVSFSSTGGGSTFTAFDVYTATNGGLLRLYNESTQTVNIDGRSSGGNTYFNNGGNVGIGTASPETLLHLTTAMSSSPTTQLYLDVDGTNTNGGGGEIIFNTSASGGSPTSYNAKITGTRVSGGTGGDSQLGFWTTLVSSSQNPQERMTITKEGNVGINTASPTEKLHVEGRIRLGSTPVICSHDNVGIDIDQNNNSGSNYFRVTRDGETTELFRVQENGNVGIGTTSPDSTLDVNGAITLSGASNEIIKSYGSIRLNIDSDSNQTDRIFIVSTGSNSELFRVDESGNGEFQGDAKVNGNIELGHASDTTIARASAGKVTIEGQPIQTKQMSMSHHNFYFNTTSTTVDYFVPFNSLTESSNPTITNYYGRMVAPYDGRIVKAVINTTAAIGTACSAQFWVATSSGVFAPSPAETVSNINLNTANTAATATFSGTSTAEFSEGDVVGLSIQKSGTTSTAYIQVTIVWEYTV